MVISVSFVIPALNEGRLLSDLLQSIASLELSEFVRVQECIVVDAQSTDDTVAVAKSYGCQVVSAQAGNVSQSRNAGAQAASGDILAFIDADCELPGDWLVEVAKQFEQTDVIAVGMSMGMTAAPTWTERTWFELAHKSRVDRQVSEVSWLPTFNLAVRRDSFESVHGFDESLTTCEDFELGFRLNTAGKLLRLDYTDGVVHKGESKGIVEFFRREAWRARGESALLQKHRRNVKVLLSYLLPGVVVAGVVLGFIILLLSWSGALTAGFVFFAGFIGLLPVLLLVLRRRVAPQYLIACWVLLNVYFFAKASGTFFRFERVSR